jgi:hypothetical protein
MDLLTEDGLLIFSTNYRRFELDEKVLQHNHVVDISDETLDKDFSRNKKIHRCWEIRKYKPEVIVESEFYNADYAKTQVKPRALPARETRPVTTPEAAPAAVPEVNVDKPVAKVDRPVTKDQTGFNPWLKKD